MNRLSHWVVRRLGLAAICSLLAVPATMLAQNTTTPVQRNIKASDLIRVVPRRKPTPEPAIAAVRLPIEAFFNLLKQNKVPEAFTQLLKGSRIGQQPEQVSVLVGTTQQAFGLYGKMISYEVYDTYTVGSSLIVTTYLTNLPVEPIRWRFVYYKPDKEWRIIDIRVDDVLVDLIE